MLTSARSTLLLWLLWVPLVEGGCTRGFLDFRVHKLLGMRVTRIDGTGFEMLVRCELENPNILGAQVEAVVFKVRIGEHLVGRGQLAGPVPVPARSRFQMEFPVRVEYADLPADFPRRAQSGALQLDTEAGLRARTKIGTYEMHLTSTGSTRIADSLPVLIQGPFRGDALRVESISLAGLELRRMRFRIRFIARNLLAFAVNVQQGEFTLDVNDRFFGKSRLDRPLRLPPRSSRAAEVEVAATHGAVASVATSMLTDDLRFRLRGTLVIDPIGGVSRLPLDVRADSSVFSR